MATNISTKPKEQTCLVDNEANQHITTDIKNLLINEHYQGGEEVIVRNGFGLPLLILVLPFLKLQLVHLHLMMF